MRSSYIAFVGRQPSGDSVRSAVESEAVVVRGDVEESVHSTHPVIEDGVYNSTRYSKRNCASTLCSTLLSQTPNLSGFSWTATATHRLVSPCLLFLL